MNINFINLFIGFFIWVRPLVREIHRMLKLSVFLKVTTIVLSRRYGFCHKGNLEIQNLVIFLLENYN